MASTKAESLIGAVVVATAIGFLIFAGQAGGFGKTNDTHQYFAKFFSAEGLSTGSEVHLAGVHVGTVTDLTLDTTTYQAIAFLDVRNDIEIPDDTEAKIASEGLLGGTFLELTPGGSDVMLVSGDEIIYTQGALSLLNLLMKFVTQPDE